MPLLWIGLALTANAATAVVGALLSERVLHAYLDALVAFAAGALLGAVLLDVLPEAVELGGPDVLRWTLLGYVGPALLGWAVGSHHHHGDADHAHPPTTPAVLLASDGLHNAVDGAAIAAAFLASPQTGLAVTAAVLAHEIPQEVGDFAILRAAGQSRRTALLALTGAQLASFAGAGAVVLAADIVAHAAGPVLALAAGSFLYVTASDLVPRIGDRGTRGQVQAFLGGIALLAAFSWGMPG